MAAACWRMLSPRPHTPPTVREGPTESHMDCGGKESGMTLQARLLWLCEQSLALISTPPRSLSASTQWHQVHSLQPLMRPGFFLDSELSFKLRQAVSPGVFRVRSDAVVVIGRPPEARCFLQTGTLPFPISGIGTVGQEGLCPSEVRLLNTRAELLMWAGLLEVRER